MSEQSNSHVFYALPIPGTAGKSTIKEALKGREMQVGEGLLEADFLEIGNPSPGADIYETITPEGDGAAVWRDITAQDPRPFYKIKSFRKRKCSYSEDMSSGNAVFFFVWERLR